MRTITFLFFLHLSACSYGQTKYQTDFAFFWKTVDNNFAYFDVQKTNWDTVKTIYQPLVDTVTSTRTFVQLLEKINNELYNGHISLNTNLPSSNRLIPTGADLWVSYQKKQFIVSAIRNGFGAEISGLQQGMRITHYLGQPIDSAIRDFLPRSVPVHDEKMFAYAANMLLAGRHNTKRSITVLSNGLERTFYPDSAIYKPSPDKSGVIEYRTLPSGFGYIRINNSLGNHSLIKAFDEALDNLQPTKGLVLDLRDTPSGGNTTVARAIMSRFIDKEAPYQKHSLPNEEKQFGVQRSWIEVVSPRGKTYRKPVVILVGRWTGSMGEGLAIGFDGMKRADIVGDKMAGLLGAIYSFTLPGTGIGFSIPAEKLFHINGKPRENFVPGFLVSNNDNCLPLAIRLLTKKSTAAKPTSAK